MSLFSGDFTNSTIIAVLARMGYTARALVYIVIGALAVMAAVNIGGETTDSRGAIREIYQQPFGQILLILLVIGLGGYVIWRCTQAFSDCDNHGRSLKGLTVRIVLVISALTHSALALYTLKLILGSHDEKGGQPGWLSSDTGLWFLAAVGIGMAVAGAAHIFKSWNIGYEEYMSLPSSQAFWMDPLCRFGLLARGVVLILIGFILTRSAMVANSSDVKNLADALSILRDNAYGPWLLGIVALGLFAFGCYSLLEACFRRIGGDDKQA